MPGSSPTIDRRDPVRRLNNVDFPTFGLPQIAIKGNASAAALSVETDCCIAASSAARHCASSFKSPLGAVFVAAPSRRAGLPLSPRARSASPSGAIVFFDSNSGERRDTSFFAASFAFFAAITFRLRGSTSPARVAPVVGVARGARPSFGRVLACRCFLPKRFAAFFAAIDSSARTHQQRRCSMRIPLYLTMHCPADAKGSTTLLLL